jgi:hypothetical protein
LYDANCAFKHRLDAPQIFVTGPSPARRAPFRMVASGELLPP